MPNKCYPLACFGDFIIRKIFFKMIKYINGIAASSTLFLTASMIFFSRLVNLELWICCWFSISEIIIIKMVKNSWVEHQIYDFSDLSVLDTFLTLIFVPRNSLSNVPLTFSLIKYYCKRSLASSIYSLLLSLLGKWEFSQESLLVPFILYWASVWSNSRTQAEIFPEKWLSDSSSIFARC